MIEGPKGIGIYIRGISKRIHGSPKKAAQKAKDNGVNFVVIMACWQAKIKSRGIVSTIRSNQVDAKQRDKLREYVFAFANVGVDVWLWGYPWGGYEEPFVASLSDATSLCRGHVRGWILDPELGYKWNRNTIEKRTGQAQDLMARTLDAMDEGLDLGITSFGSAKGHANFPWNIFSQYGFGSPQCYNFTPTFISRSLCQWHDLGWEYIVPSIQSFGEQSGKNLHRYLERFFHKELPKIHGFVFWSWRQISKLEWDAISWWSNFFKENQTNGI